MTTHLIKNIRLLGAAAGIAGLSGCYTVPVETNAVVAPVATPAPVVVTPVVAPAPVVVAPAWRYWGPYWGPRFHGPHHGPHFHGRCR